MHLQLTAARGLLIGGVMALAACDHTGPPTIPDYGEIAGGRFAGLGVDAVWTEDGTGLLFSGVCLTNQTPKGPVFAAALSVIPAIGGSISWQRCELYHSTRMPVDSQGKFWAAALGADGRLLYEESVTDLQGIPGSNSGPAVAFPARTDAGLWLTDSAYPLSRAQRLLALYHVDATGTKAATDDQVDWLLNLAWAGPSTFVALGANLLARQGVYLPRPLRIVRGSIGPSGASLDVISGTERARLYSLAEAGATVVFTRDTLVVERVPTGGGSALVVATLPSLAGRALMDISCKAERCLLLTQETDSSNHLQSTFWSLMLDTGALTVLQTYPRALTTAKVSPRSGDVLASGTLFSGLFR